MVQVVRSLLLAQTQKFDVCICDSMRQKEEICSQLLQMLYGQTSNDTNANISKLVLVTSLRFVIRSSEEMDENDNLAFESWHSDDYEKASLVENEQTKAILLGDWKNLVGTLETNGDICQDENAKIVEAVREKYHYAGGCARYMFDKTIGQLTEALNKAFTKVTDWSVFSRTNISESTPDAVNCLMQQLYAKETNY